jgi:SPOR domain
MKHLILVLLMAASFATYAQRNRDKEKAPVEDLAAIRPRFETPIDTGAQYSGNQVRNVPVVKPTMLVNDKVNSVLDSIDRINAIRKFVPGYTIQIYSGLNREEAGNARKKASDELEMRADLQYLQPKFRVRVGYYFTSIDAQKDLVRLRRAFPNAILVPENVPIK